MRELIMTDQAMREYTSWIKSGDTRIADKIDALIDCALQDPYSGLGKPEPLVGNLSGKWSRRITGRDRLVYSVSEDAITVYQCKGHYFDK